MGIESLALDYNIGLLVIDDDDISCAAITGVLAKLGFKNIFVARSGEEAIEGFSVDQVNIVLLDWHLPEMNGLQVLEALRTCYSNLPIVMVSGDEDPAHQELALESGCEYFLLKPVSVARVEAVFRHLLEQGKLSQEK